MALRSGVLYLLKDRLQLYSPLTGKVLELKFTPAMIRDLDVVDIEVIETAIKTFVTNGKIAPLGLFIVLSDNAYFTKDFVSTAQPNTSPMAADVQKELLRQQAEQFVEHVPFDNVVSKNIPLKNGIKVVATNKDFYEAIAMAFEHNSFILLGILPGLIVSPGFGAQPVLSAAMATTVITKANALKAYDLLNQQVYEPNVASTEEVDEVALEKQHPKKASRKQIYLVAAIFAVVIVLLVVVVMQFTAPPPKWSANPTPPPPAPAAQPVATSSAGATTETASPSASLTSNLVVEIINDADTASVGDSLRENLNTYKFKRVTNETQTALGSSSTVISFSPAILQSVRTLVLDEVRKVRTNVTVQDKTSATADITIIIGQ